MDQAILDELSKTYPHSVRLTEVKVRDRGEVKKLDAGELPLHVGDRVLLEVDGEVTYGVVYVEPYRTPFIPPMRVLKPILRECTMSIATGPSSRYSRERTRPSSFRTSPGSMDPGK